MASVKRFLVVWARWGFALLVLASLVQCAPGTMMPGEMPGEVPMPEVDEIPSFEGTLASILEGEPAITTSLSDAVTEVAFLDGYQPKVVSRR